MSSNLRVCKSIALYCSRLRNSLASSSALAYSRVPARGTRRGWCLKARLRGLACASSPANCSRGFATRSIDSPTLSPLFFSVICLFFVSCASNVFVPLNDPANTVPPEERIVSPNFQKLVALLKGLGYDGVGLQYESVETQNLLYTVFMDPKTHDREIQLVYTGAALSYDPRYKSLTIGGSRELPALINFIQKIPARAIAVKPGNGNGANATK